MTRTDTLPAPVGQRPREFIRWCVKSGLGLAVNLALLTVWVDYLDIPPEIAIFINWLLLSVYGYLLARHWVFDETVELSGPLEHARQYVGMQGVMVSGKALNYLVYVALIWLGIDYRVSWVIGAVAGLLVNFGGNRWLWTDDQPADG